MDWKKPLGDHLYQLRHAKRLTLKQVGEQVGVKYTDLSKLERGLRPGITLDAFCRLAEFYEVSTDYLLGCKDTS
jgi:transcriptional regulator with XRE-family HTH domain